MLPSGWEMVRYSGAGVGNCTFRVADFSVPPSIHEEPSFGVELERFHFADFFQMLDTAIALVPTCPPKYFNKLAWICFN